MEKRLHVLIAEELTRKLLDERARSIADADVCWPFAAHDGLVALDALEDRRWVTGDWRLFDSAAIALWRWAHEIAAEASRTNLSRPSLESAMVAYGLQVRLRGAARARAMVDQFCAERGIPSRSTSLDVVASDPYLRDAFLSQRHRWRALRLYANPGRSSWMSDLRERAVASRWLRRIQAAVDGTPDPSRAERRAKTVGVFVFGQRPVDLFEPINTELAKRGWRAVVFSYRPTSSPGAIDFDRAVRQSGRSLSWRSGERWSVGADAMYASPVSARLTVQALDASWMTARVQLERHRRVLDRWRPDVVMSFGPDTMSLALQGAAAEQGIPSVLLPHGLLDPMPQTWSLLHATATAVPGWGCVRANARDPLGRRQDGLVVVGHPDYDAILRPAGDRAPVSPSDVGASARRPHVVLLFAEWAIDLAGHAMQRRTLEMTAKALPQDAFLVCKLHPARSEREMCARVLGGSLPSDAFRIVGDDLSTPVLLRASTIAVAPEHSGVLGDAIAAGVPAIGIRQPERPLGTADAVHPGRDHRNVCRLVDDLDELKDAVISLTHDGDARARLLNQRDAYIKEFLFSSDGHSSTRIADLVEHLAAGGGPETFVPRVVGASVAPR